LDNVVREWVAGPRRFASCANLAARLLPEAIERSYRCNSAATFIMAAS
jgi:hypothetical protein